MKTVQEWKLLLENGSLDSFFTQSCAIEPEQLGAYRTRCFRVLDGLHAQFGHTKARLFSAPGRTELSGNHTDHQRGHVLAASVNLDVIAAAAPNGLDCIRIQSEGYPMDEISLSDLSPKEEETNTAAALIRGIAAKMQELGVTISGFDAYTTSNVLKGSGLSSSAAFEVLVGKLCSALFGGDRFSAAELAQIGQYAENVYFGKPCGLMDQMACAVGGIIAIDFADAVQPDILPISFDFTACGHALCILDSGADHADLTGEYAAIPAEMKRVAACFSRSCLSEVPEAAFYEALPKLRQQCGDRALLRAMHFYEDDKRVLRQAAALQRGDFPSFLEEETASGASSYMYLQNVLAASAPPEQQAVALALALCRKALDGTGAYRVHGGGFAGTVQAFVPLERLEQFCTAVTAVFGKEACHVLKIRSAGAVEFCAEL